MIFRIPEICYINLVDMNVKILFPTVLMFSSILFGVQNILDQNVNAFDNSGIRYIASLDPYQIVSEDRNGIKEFTSQQKMPFIAMSI